MGPMSKMDSVYAVGAGARGSAAPGCVIFWGSEDQFKERGVVKLFQVHTTDKLILIWGKREEWENCWISLQVQYLFMYSACC